MSKKIKGIITSIICISIYLNSYLVSGVLMRYFNIKSEMLLAFITNIIITTILVLIYRKQILKELKIFKDNYKESMSIGFEYWIIGLACMISFNLAISIFTSAGAASNEQAVQKLINSYPLLMFLEAGFIAPMCEEIVFRKCIRNIFSNSYLFVIISSLFFGLLHVLGADSFEQALYILPYSSLGIALALMYKKTDTIFTSVSIHMIHNILLVLLSVL